MKPDSKGATWQNTDYLKIWLALQKEYKLKCQKEKKKRERKKIKANLLHCPWQHSTWFINIVLPTVTSIINNLFPARQLPNLFMLLIPNFHSSGQMYK